MVRSSPLLRWDGVCREVPSLLRGTPLLEGLWLVVRGVMAVGLLAIYGGTVVLAVGLVPLAVPPFTAGDVGELGMGFRFVREGPSRW